ncbi:Dolichyl-phosphate-mannose-protein mannosyltransferase [uncultured archaeon]|nr:Dolichyl-phosphate-mannose-protein mannosyltransferase [uncultured archaeon]
MRLGEGKFEDAALVFSAIACIALFMLFFPPFYASIDEQGYLRNAVLLSHGKIGEPAPEYASRSTVFNGTEYISDRVLGRSVSLIPFLPFGISGVMLSGLIIHLINFFILIKIFEKLKVSKIFSLIYLFLPTFIWESRTLYPELLTLTFFLAAFCFYISERRRDWAVSGFLAGLAVLVRYDAVYGVAAMALAALISSRKKFLWFFLGGIPCAAFLFAFNSAVYGGAFTSGNGSVLRLFLRFSADRLPNFIAYLGILLLYLPLMLASPFIEKKSGLRKEFALFAAAYLVFNGMFTDLFNFDFSLSSLFTARLRYLVPLIGVLIIPYACMLDSWTGVLSNKIGLLRKNPAATPLALFVVMFLVAAYSSDVHQDYLSEKRSAAFGTIYANTEAGSLILGSSDDSMYFVRGFFPDRKYFSIDPKPDLAGNPQGIDPVAEFRKAGKGYMLLIDYTNVSSDTSPRAELVKGERKKAFDFYERNHGSFELVAEDKKISLALYRYNGGPLQE